MNQKQFKKKYPTASFDMMAEEAIASAELAGANSNWEKEFHELFVTGVGGGTKHIDSEIQPFETKILIKQFISDEIAKAKQEERDRIIKAMTGKKLNPYKEEIQGYNDRIDDEIAIAKTLLT